MKFRIRLSMILVCLQVGVGCPVHSDMPTQRVEVQVSSRTGTADVTIQTKVPGQITSQPARSHWWITALRVVQQILGGTIFLPS